MHSLPICHNALLLAIPARPSSSEQLKEELKAIVSTTSKKRPASTISDEDDEVIPVESASPVVVRQPVKRLPQTKPDYHSFAPKDRT